MTYDSWKTTDPRDYEPEPEEAPSELQAAYERIQELEAVLRKCAEHFEYTDAPILGLINTALEPFPSCAGV